MSPTIIVEKDGLLPSTISYHANHDAFSTLRKVLLISLSFACTLAVLSYSRGNLEVPTLADLAESCPQPPPLEPTQNGELWRTLVDTYKSSEFVTRAANWLGGAVRVRLVLMLSQNMQRFDAILQDGEF